MAVIYPIIAILIVDKVRFTEYFTAPSASFSSLGEVISHLAPADMLILGSGLVGAIAAGLTMRYLRKKDTECFKEMSRLSRTPFRDFFNMAI